MNGVLHEKQEYARSNKRSLSFLFFFPVQYYLQRKSKPSTVKSKLCIAVLWQHAASIGNNFYCISAFLTLLRILYIWIVRQERLGVYGWNWLTEVEDDVRIWTVNLAYFIELILQVPVGLWFSYIQQHSEYGYVIGFLAWDFSCHLFGLKIGLRC